MTAVNKITPAISNNDLNVTYIPNENYYSKNKNYKYF